MARKPLGVQFAFPATASSLPAHHLERTPPQTTRSWPTQDSAITGGYLLKKSLPHGSATALQIRFDFSEFLPTGLVSFALIELLALGYGWFFTGA
ncbi:MAG: hypothetical protein KA244_00005 [Deltaproteobacteria bacterium]|nr:hypothetical protein [Deltaproteobacteria bacterium]